MTWIKLDDAFVEHPKIVGLSDGAFRLLVTGLSYCGRWNTDGVIPRGAIKMKPRLLRELVSNGNFHEKGHWCKTCPAVPTGAVYVHDYLVYNPTAEEVETAQGRRTERARQAARARWEHPPSSANGNAPSMPPSMPDAMLANAPVPNPITSTSSSVGSPPAAEPVDDDEDLSEDQPPDPIEVTVNAVFARCADAKTEGIAPKSPNAYRTRVLQNLELEHGAELRAVIASHPDAPVQTLAGWVLGEPNSLERYRRADA